MFGFLKEAKEPIDSFGNAVDKIFTSDEERLTRAEAIERIKLEPMKYRNALDLLNAKSNILFVKCARPFNVYLAGINWTITNCAVSIFDKKINEAYVQASLYAFLVALGAYGIMRMMEK